MVFLGGSIPVAYSALEKVPIWLFTCVTIGISCICLIPSAAIIEKVKWTKLGRRNYYGIFMQALLTCTRYTVFLLYGVSYTSVISAGVINSMVTA